MDEDLRRLEERLSAISNGLSVEELLCHRDLLESALVECMKSSSYESKKMARQVLKKCGLKYIAL